MIQALKNTSKVSKLPGRRARLGAPISRTRVPRCPRQAQFTPGTLLWRGASSGADQLQTLLKEAARLCERMEAMVQPRMLRVTAMDKGDVVVFDARQVSRFFAAGKYTGFVVDGRDYLANESLRCLEARLRHASFMRVHRSELVNLEHVTRLKRTADAGYVVLVDGQEAPVSRILLQTVRTRLLGPSCS